jgi:glutathione S-transferase
MTLPLPLRLAGAPGSPYTRKMRGLLRYRRIAHEIFHMNGPETRDLPRARPPLLPTFYLPDENGETVAITDSTPLLRRFEQEWSERSVIPTDPVVAFLDELLEDYADEWLTKCMFHFRWYHEADATKARMVLPHWGAIDVSDEQIAPMQKLVGDHQIERLRVVGSNDITAPVIEDSYVRFLNAFDAHLQGSKFLFGQRPASADFGLMGQLTCLALFDPTPSAITLRESPRVYAWTEMVEELSGMEVTEGQWNAAGAIPSTINGLLCEIGRTYVPAMLANADAIARGADQVETTIDGKPWVQNPFPYQKKCLGWIRDSRANLAPADRTKVDEILAGTGCEALFE